MSCLFNSLGCLLNIPSYQLRQKICDYLLTNPELLDTCQTSDIIKWESGVKLETYIIKMRNNSTWGGAIEIKATCNIYNCRIIVVNIRNNRRNRNLISQLGNSGKDIEFIPNKNANSDISKTIKITWNGGHFEPLNRVK